ncbi:MAG: hypothetical protein J6R35_04145, partial [Clostridia bacterium]|nr:hypothetical protein [Clostridia bacterium]
DHNTDRRLGVYCTDTGIGMVGIINEALLYSNLGVIEALPALPKGWDEGSIKGLRARTNAEVDVLWTKDEVTVVVTSGCVQEIAVSVYGTSPQTAIFNAGETKTFTFKRG